MANNANYNKIAFYQGRAASTATGFSTFSENGLFYFTCNKSNEVYLYSSGFTSAAARNRNLHKLSENLLFAKSYERVQESKNRFYFLIKTDEQEELVRSKFFATEDAMNVFIGWIMGSKFVIDYSQNIDNESPTVNTTILKGNYNKYINYTIYKGNNQKLYFVYADKDDNTYLLNPVISGFDNEEAVKKMVETVNEVARRPKAYKVNLAKSGKYFFYLKNNEETLAKSIFFNNEKEMLKVIEKLVNHKNTGRTIVSSKLKDRVEINSTPNGKDDFEEVLKAQQKAELEVRLKKRDKETQKKQEQTNLSLEQVYQNRLNVKEEDIAKKTQKEAQLLPQNKALNGADIEVPTNLKELSPKNPTINIENKINANANQHLSGKKLKVRTVDANKDGATNLLKPEKKLKVRTVDANKELREKEIEANKQANAESVKPERKLKVRTVDANKDDMAKTENANKPIEGKNVSPEKKLKVRTVDANKTISVKTIEANQPVEAKIDTTKKKLKVRTVDANKKVIINKQPINSELQSAGKKNENNTNADITYEKKLAQDKLETLKRNALNEKPKLKVKELEKPTEQNEFSIVKIIKPAIILLLVFAMVGFGILAFLSRNEQYNAVEQVSAAEIIIEEPDKSSLPQFTPGKIGASAASISNFKAGTVEQLLKSCIEDAYCAAPSNFHWVEANFEDGLSVLSASAKASLMHIVELMKGYPEMKLTISGHTAFGETDKNIASLSEVRAKTVLEYFTKNGIAKDRLKQQGMGDTQPVNFGSSLTAKHQNKRIDFTLVQK